MTRKRCKKLLMGRNRSRNRVERYIREKSGIPNAEIYDAYCREFDEFMQNVSDILLNTLEKMLVAQCAINVFQRYVIDEATPWTEEAQKSAEMFMKERGN